MDQIKGLYANHFRVGRNHHEVVIDFGQHYEDTQDACIHTRIITSPAYAKEFLKVLVQTLDEYEQQKG